MEVGQSIKKIREWKNLSQQYMADELNISQQNYSRYETGEVEVSVVRLQEIAKILEVPISYIFELDEKAIFNSYQVTNSGNHNHHVERILDLRDKDLVEDLKKQHQIHISDLKTQYDARIADLKKENEYLKSILDKTLKN